MQNLLPDEALRLQARAGHSLSPQQKNRLQMYEDLIRKQCVQSHAALEICAGVSEEVSQPCTTCHMLANQELLKRVDTERQRRLSNIGERPEDWSAFDEHLLDMRVRTLHASNGKNTTM